MPVESNIELGSGSLYFKGCDKPIPVKVGEFATEEAWSSEVWADNVKHLSLNPDPSVEFNRNWTTVKCCECDYEFPVTELYVLLNGTTGWRCPRCALKAAIENAKKRSNV